jgi:hypothetical protein
VLHVGQLNGIEKYALAVATLLQLDMSLLSNSYVLHADAAGRAVDVDHGVILPPGVRIARFELLLGL